LTLQGKPCIIKTVKEINQTKNGGNDMRKQQLIELMNTIYNPLDEVSAHNGIVSVVGNMTEQEAYKHWFKLRKWAKENQKLYESEKVIISDFARHLLTTEKEFFYVSFNEKIRPMKRNKVLSKFFRNDSINDFVYVMENENCVIFSDGSTSFACNYMDCDEDAISEVIDWIFSYR